MLYECYMNIRYITSQLGLYFLWELMGSPWKNLEANLVRSFLLMFFPRVVRMDSALRLWHFIADSMIQSSNLSLLFSFLIYCFMSILDSDDFCPQELVFLPQILTLLHDEFSAFLQLLIALSQSPEFLEEMIH